jgi:hypothetical protein
MRIVVAAVFAVIGVPLIVSALGTLAAASSMTDRTFAMMQIIAGLLCFLIAVVAGLMRPPVRAPVEPPQPVAPPAAAPSARLRDGLGMAVVITVLAIGLIVLAVQLRTPGRDRDARAGVPSPASGSVPGPGSGTVRSMTPVVAPAGRSEAGRSPVKPHAPARARRGRDDDD